MLRKVDTIEQSIEAHTPTLSLIRKEKGDDYVESYVKLWIIDFQMSVNLKTKLSEFQIDALAEMLLSDFWGLTISDVKNVLTWAKKGKYGEFYESLSIHKMYQWFAEYFDERCEVYAMRTQREHDIIKKELERSRK